MKELENKVWPLFESGHIKPIIHNVFGLEEVEKAHSLIKNNKNIGKVVLRVN